MYPSNAVLNDSNPTIRGKQIVWESAYINEDGTTGGEILFFEIGGTEQHPTNISQSIGGDTIPMFGTDFIAWQSMFDDGYEFKLATIGEPVAHGSITLEVNGDMVAEMDETFLLELTAVVNNQPDLPGSIVVDTPELEITIINDDSPFIDFGDAPTSQTLLEDGGARHSVDTNLHLGYLIDSEIDARPDVLASGDDIYPDSLSDDEDGVDLSDITLLGSNGLLDATDYRVSNMLLTGQMAQFDISVFNQMLNESNEPASAYLNAWIDMNGDGTFQANEQVIFMDWADLDGDGITEETHFHDR